MKGLITATALAAAIAASPAWAQSKRSGPAQPSPLAERALAGNSQPDVLLDIPDLSVEEITLEVDKLEAHVSLDARLANLLKLTAGVDANIDKVKLSVKGVHAQVTLIVRLENVRAIIERTLQTLDNNPNIVTGLLNTVDNTVGTVGGVANNAVGTVGGVANNALKTGTVLNLAQAGLTQLSQTTDATGQILHKVRDRAGNLLDVVTDSAGKIISSTRSAK
jgi:hypothetical protein